MKISFNWLKDYVALNQRAEETARLLTSAGLEVKGVESFLGLKDKVMEIEITSNRPDWLSHVGVAREIAAVSGGKLVYPEWQNLEKKGKAAFVRDRKKILPIEIQDTQYCPYYSACLLENVVFGESPDFIKKRLNAVGMRPINLIVDVTNYVLLELGQPLHAFDWDHLSQEKILVRRAREKESLRAINGTDYPLNTRDLLITDGARPIALAGVMGGLESEVSLKTKNILLESAYFSPAVIRRTSQRLGLSSDSSYRFERGVDPVGVDTGRERAIRLICQYAKSVGNVSVVFKGGRLPKKTGTIQFPLGEIRRILGVDIPSQKVSQYFRALGLSVKPAKKGTVTVGVPSFRQDLTRPVDLVEEAARLYGYDRITETLPDIEPVYIEESCLRKTEEMARETALGSGLNETVTFSLISEKVFEKLAVPLLAVTRVVNPQNKELTLMRPSLFPSLLEVVKTNFYHSSSNDVRLFEIANVYGPEVNQALPKEELTFAVAVAGARNSHWLEKGRKYTFFDVKGVFEEIFERLGIQEIKFVPYENPFLEQAFSMECQGMALGVLGKVSNPVKSFYDISSDAFIGQISLEKIAHAARFERRYKLLPKYPASRRDMALILGENVPAGEVIDHVRSLGFEFMRAIDLLDFYRGGQIPTGKKSLAFSIEYRSDEKTLTAEEVNDLHAKVVESVTRHFSAQLRS